MWDRLVAYDDLTLLSVMAVAIFMFRSEVLLCCKNKEEVMAVFENGQLARLRTIPMLQSLLFLEHLKG